MDASQVSYLLYGQIQDYKEEYYKQNAKGISFSNAVKALVNRGETFCGSPSKPDFLTWDLNEVAGLKKLIRRIPVNAEEGTDARVMLIDQIWHCYPKGDVQILLESCYTSADFLMLDFFSVIYVLDGDCTLYLWDEAISMETGALCILPPRTPFYVMTGPNDLVIDIQSKEKNFRDNFSQLLKYKTVLTSFFRRVLLEEDKSRILFFLPPDKRIYLLIQNLFLEYMADDPYSATAFNNFLQIFYLCIIRSTDSTYRYYASRGKGREGMALPAIMEYIAQNFYTLTLEELAGHFHYSSTYMSRLVQRMTGRSFREIVTELKMNEAKELLEHTGLSCSMIAQCVGYHNPDSFAYSFKKSAGMTPSEYRRQKSRNNKKGEESYEAGF